MPRALTGAGARRRRNRWALGPVLVLAVVAGGLGACSSDDDRGGRGPTDTTTDTTTDPATTGPATDPTPTAGRPPAVPPGGGPVWALDFPDPFVVAENGRYYAFGTVSGLIQVQRLTSEGLEGWTGPDEALLAEPAWATPLSAWAPAVLPRGDRYLLYYTAQVAGTDQHCISVAESPTVAGPYRDESEAPFLCPTASGGAIDPSPVVGPDGALHLLWKNDGVTLRSESSIWSQPLRPGGRELAGDPTRLITTDQNWEYPHVEAPSMVEVDGTWWLAYSANWWNQPAYGVGLARCDSPTGPCEKPWDRPLLASAPGRFGPGGAEFLRGVGGPPLVAYHAWLAEPGYPGHRALHLAAVDVGTDPPTIGA